MQHFIPGNYSPLVRVCQCTAFITSTCSYTRQRIIQIALRWQVVSMLSLPAIFGFLFWNFRQKWVAIQILTIMGWYWSHTWRKCIKNVEKNKWFLPQVNKLQRYKINKGVFIGISEGRKKSYIGQKLKLYTSDEDWKPRNHYSLIKMFWPLDSGTKRERERERDK